MIGNFFKIYISNVYLLECNGGKFGENCTNDCGHCLHREQCHFIDGTCSNGCNKGFKAFSVKTVSRYNKEN